MINNNTENTETGCESAGTVDGGMPSMKESRPTSLEEEKTVSSHSTMDATGIENQDSDLIEMEELTRHAIISHDPRIKKKIIGILKKYDKKAIPFIMRIANTTRLPGVKSCAFAAIDDLLDL